MEQPPFVMRVMFMQRCPVLLLKKKAEEEGRFFRESRKNQRTCVVDTKAAEIKLEGSTAAHLPNHPVAGESLKRPDESKLSSRRFLLPPLVVLRTPCADCIGVPRKC